MTESWQFDLTITVRRPEQERPSVIAWTHGALKHESTRRSAAVILRGLAEELEGKDAGQCERTTR